MKYNVLPLLVLLFLFYSLFISSYAINQKVIVIIPEGAGKNSVPHFVPNPINIRVGETVEWINKDNTIHTVSSVGDSDNDLNLNSSSSKDFSLPASLFDSNMLFPGDSFVYTFEGEGVYSYICIIHPNMVWTINVEINPNNKMST